MRKLFFTALSAVGFLFPKVCCAQFIGYTAPQTVQQVLATNLNCTGSPQYFPITNLGQTEHYLSVGSVINANRFQAEIDGIDAQGNSYTISDVLENAGLVIATRQGTVFGSGYFPQIQVRILCSPNTATFSASYSGASSTENQISGSYLSAKIDKINFFAVPANTNEQDNFQTPFGSSAGTLYFQYNTTSIAGGSITVFCGFSGVASSSIAFTATLANTLGLQAFSIPDQSCPFAEVFYSSPGGGNTVTAEYVFAVPGRGLNSTSIIGSVTQGTTPWITQSTTSATVLSGQQAVTNAATALPSSALTHGICVEALSTNTASVFIGPSTVTTSTGIELPPKSSVCLGVSNSNAIFVIAAAGGSSVTWVGN